MNESLEETDIGTLKFNSPVNSTKKFPVLQRIGFRSNGCTCQDLSCNCCLGINMEQFQVNREGTNITSNQQLIVRVHQSVLKIGQFSRCFFCCKLVVLS